MSNKRRNLGHKESFFKDAPFSSIHKDKNLEIDQCVVILVTYDLFCADAYVLDVIGCLICAYQRR